MGFGLGSIFSRSRMAIGVLLVYASAQLAAHVMLNLHVVNVQLVSHANQAVSDAAVERIRDAGDTASLPALQQKADSEAALTLLMLMKNRPDFCEKYFEIVPNGLRDTVSQATVDVARILAKSHESPCPP